MTYAAHEKEFYEKHYQKNLSISEGFDGNLIWRQCFSPEARYGLVDKTLTSYLGPKRLIVELGCAQGHTLTYCKDKFNFSRAVGVDIAFPRNQINNLGIEFLTANLNQGFPFSDGEVDVMMAMMCFEHLFCPFFIFSELKRCLSKDGIAFVNLPLVTSIKNRVRLLFGRLPVTSVPYERWFQMSEWDGNHLHYFSLDSIKAMANHLSMKIVDLSGVGRFHKLKSTFPTLLAGELSFSLMHKS